MSERLLTLMQWRGNRYKEIAGTLPGLITRHSEGGNAILKYPSGSAGVCLDRAVPQTAVGTDKHRPTPQVSLLSLWHPDQYFYLRTIVSNITALPCILQYLRRRWLQKLTSHREGHCIQALELTPCTLLFVPHWQVIPFPFWCLRDICHFNIMGKLSCLLYLLLSSSSFICCRKPLYLLNSQRHSCKSSYHWISPKLQEFQEHNFYNGLAFILCSIVFLKLPSAFEFW